MVKRFERPINEVTIQPEAAGGGFFGWFPMLILGALIGLVLSGLVISNQYVVEAYITIAENKLADMSEQKRTVLVYTVMGGIALFLILTRAHFLRSGITWGLALGVFLWVPFGNHILAWVPEAEEAVPNIRASVDDFIAERSYLQNIRDLAEDRVPVPEGRRIAPLAEAEEPSLPQIGSEGN